MSRTNRMAMAAAVAATLAYPSIKSSSTAHWRASAARVTAWSRRPLCR
jgi:hypothetical protein